MCLFWRKTKQPLGQIWSGFMCHLAFYQTRCLGLTVCRNCCNFAAIVIFANTLFSFFYSFRLLPLFNVQFSLTLARNPENAIVVVLSRAEKRRSGEGEEKVPLLLCPLSKYLLKWNGLSLNCWTHCYCRWNSAIVANCDKMSFLVLVDRKMKNTEETKAVRIYLSWWIRKPDNDERVSRV